MTGFPNSTRTEHDIATHIASVFGRFPNLAGFTIVDRSGLPHDQRTDQLFVGDIGFCPAVSEHEHGKAINRISDVLSTLVEERPEAFDLLRGRTFSRTVH